MDYSLLGYKKPLYILPFDHRNTFAEHMFNLKKGDALSPEQINLVKEFKMLIYKGFKDSLEKLIPTDFGAILCDEEYGSEVLLDARNNGFVTILTIEKSGESEFKFAYDNFQEHIEKFKPVLTKVLIKYSPSDSKESKDAQKKNLKIISDYSHSNNYKFLLEVLVVPKDAELKTVNGDKEEFDAKLRPALTVEVIKDLQGEGIEPDVWKLEGFDTQEDYKAVVIAARADGRDNVGIVVLGRGAGPDKVQEWLEVGSKVRGVIGFAVGRTVFWDALTKFYKGEIGKAEVIQTVSENFRNFYNVFIENQPTS